MSPAFSIVYPTRHRPEFVRQALHVLEQQRHDDFEVIVSDNFVDPDRSCAAVCKASPLANLRYVTPPEPVGMVENWVHALGHARGDYVAFLTDKMFVLPDALARVSRAITRAGEPDVVSWTSDAYNPASYDDYFGEGTYFDLSPDGRARSESVAYVPSEALDRRGRAEVSRQEQTPADYARGKIAFGAYRRTLIDRIVERFGSLFHNINPDYTSMVLGLSEARSAIEMTRSCVVSVNTDISNGMLTDANDAAMRAFLDDLAGGIGAILPELLVPGVYASQQNCVAHDYLSPRKRFGLTFAFDQVNWITYCHEDVHRPTRVWSSPEVEAEQKGLLEAFLGALDPTTRAAVQARLAERDAAARAKLAPPPPPRPRPAPVRAAGRLRRRVRPPVLPPQPRAHERIDDAIQAVGGS